MARDDRHAHSGSAAGVRKLGEYSEGGSRPSKNNCTSDASGPEEAEQTWEYWWQRKNDIVDGFIEQRPGRAARPVSVRGGTKVREECAIEKSGEQERYRAKTWSDVLNEFLKWYNDYRDSYLVFTDPTGEEVRAEMPNSHQPQYGDKYYARLKAFERQVVREYDDPHSVMLTFSGSSRNGDGGWRCPCDHLRDVVESWRPKRGRGVYHTIRDVLEGRNWEYAIVIEKHRSGYGHVHCAVFVDGEVEESEFHPVIDAHLRVCRIAHRDAHDYYSHNEDDRPISVKRIDPNAHDVEVIGNLGSYIGSYIGAYGEPLFDRRFDELMFRAAVWATGTQLVRFSNGANEMISRERGASEGDPAPEEVIPNPEYDPVVHGHPSSDVRPFEVVNPGWSIVGVARVQGDEERLFDIHRGEVTWLEIDDESGLDPPNPQPMDRPRPRTNETRIRSY